MRRIAWLSLVLIASAAVVSTHTYAQTIKLSVDLTDAPRNIFHERLTIPAKPGPMTLVYPKWIPGNHRPSGPITNLVGIKLERTREQPTLENDPRANGEHSPSGRGQEAEGDGRQEQEEPGQQPAGFEPARERHPT